MALSIGGQDVGFVGAGEHEGLASRADRVIEALAVKAMVLFRNRRCAPRRAEIRSAGRSARVCAEATPISISSRSSAAATESQVVMSIRISTLACRSWNRDMAASKRSHTKLDMIWIEILPRISSVRLPSRLGTLRTIEFKDRQVSATSMPSSVSIIRGSAPAQRHAELGFEALEGETEGRLLTPHRPPGAAHSAGLGDLVKCLQEIPIDIPRKTLRGVDHSLPQIDCGMTGRHRRRGPGQCKWSRSARTCMRRSHDIGAARTRQRARSRRRRLHGPFLRARARRPPWPMARCCSSAPPARRSGCSRVVQHLVWSPVGCAIAVAHGSAWR